MLLYLYFLLINSIRIIFSFNDDRVEIVLKIDGHITNTTIKRIEEKFNFHYKKRLFNNFYLFDKIQLNKRNKRDEINDKEEILIKEDPQIKWAQIQIPIKRERRYYLKEDYAVNYLLNKCNKTDLEFNDPYWSYQWYLNDGCIEGYNLNVTYAWRNGYTGKGVVVSIIDDGIEYNNNDLLLNYDKNASIDLNDNDLDPLPRYDVTNENKHGTRCAGEIASVANNSFCGIGVAFNTRIGGIRLLDGVINDRLESEALLFNINYIDIISASWGPLDNGKVVEGPSLLTKEAFKKGIKEGRFNKGTIYVWASGNGGRHMDNCNCDGYITSIYTITISSITRDHNIPKYSEKCTSILASTYSSGGAFMSNNIITSDLNNKCTNKHTGTSASAPIAAGIIALVLEVNSKLTWRDIQYLIIYTSQSLDIKNHKWTINGIGKRVSHHFGYGLMNAGNMIELAKKWNLIGKQLKCKINILNTKTNKFKINSKETGIFKINVKTLSSSSSSNSSNSTYRLCNTNINLLEHVQSLLTIESEHRGALIITLVSPSGTQSNLLDLRKNDLSKDGFNEWPFMSIFYWNENPNGQWTLKIKNTANTSCLLKKWSLILYGIEYFNN